MSRMPPVPDSSARPAERAVVNDYDSFAEEYSAGNEASLINGYYTRPAVLDLAGDVAGRRILDAGCGSGPLSAALRDRGATFLRYHGLLAIGAVLALVMWHTDLSIIAMIGIILLIGIVKKNAIMMIDFAIAAERGEGLRPRDAIYQACLLRFRPILMTTMSAMLGALPLALGHGVGGELRRPLGITIIGGLIVSQLLTLYTTPVVYLQLDRLRLRWKGEPVREPVQA